jgi:hypothetical protein
MTEQEKFYKEYPQYSGILEMHESGSIDWLNAMIPVRMFAVWQAAKKTVEAEQTVDSLISAQYENMKGQLWAATQEVERLQDAINVIKERCANLAELSYCKDKEQHLLLARVAQHIREMK